MGLRRLMWVVALALPIASVGAPADAQTREATCRKVAGVITQVDPSSMSLAPTGKPTVTGRIDPRTHVAIDGQPGRVADLQVTYVAKGQLCLDDVWTQITVATH